MKSENQIQTISTNINQKYYISTTYRATVVYFGEVWYYETIVWSMKAGKLDKIIRTSDSGSDYRMAKQKHNRLVKIFEYLEERNLRNNDSN